MSIYQDTPTGTMTQIIIFMCNGTQKEIKRAGITVHGTSIEIWQQYILIEKNITFVNCMKKMAV